MLTANAISNNLFQPFINHVKFQTLAHEKNLSIISYIIQEKLIDPQTLATQLARDFCLPLLDLNAFDKSLVKFEWLIGLNEHCILPLWQQQEKIWVAIADPTNQVGLELIKFNTGFTPQCIVVEADKLQAMIKAILTEQTAAAITDLPQLELDHLAQATLIEKPSFDINDDAPIIRYVNKILLEAVQKNASDIHFEPYEDHYRIRFRLDGLLYEIANPPFNLANRIATRLKILAHLDIAERRLPQDGRFKFTLPNQKVVDLRVSSCPTVHGEKIVLRLLNSHELTLFIDSLGFESEQQQLFLDAIKKSQGMILVTGPTGSGKTITLYTALNYLNTPAVNILTIEDPVEIHLAGINQVNIQTKTGLTFAHTLRAFLRQDPDTIMIGEIRDQETAEIAVKAAQTGHLVLSTLHTNNAIATLARLANLGISPYNIATSIQLIIAQRLVRRLCDHCKILINNFYEPHGCEQCTHGYKGRIGIFEILPMTEAISESVMRGSSPVDIANAALMMSLRETGMNKVKQGLTSLTEINRVTG